MTSPDVPQYDPDSLEGLEEEQGWFSRLVNQGATMDGANENPDGSINARQTACQELGYQENMYGETRGQREGRQASEAAQNEWLAENGYESVEDYLKDKAKKGLAAVAGGIITGAAIYGTMLMATDDRQPHELSKAEKITRRYARKRRKGMRIRRAWEWIRDRNKANEGYEPSPLASNHADRLRWRAGKRPKAEYDRKRRRET